MSWTINGKYFENCTCEVVCPCTASFALGADYDRCEVVLVFHVDSGEIEGVEVADLTVAAVIDSPKIMSHGDWQLGLLIDAAASEEQTAKLGAVFSGQLGGPLTVLGPLISGMLGIERVPMQFTSQNGRHTLLMGDMGQLDVQDVVPFGIETGESARLAGIFHPLGNELTISKAGESRLNAFGLTPALAGKSGFSTTFAWSG